MSRAPETLTLDESERLLTHLTTHYPSNWAKWKNLRNYTMALLMLDAGLRVGEVVRLTILDLIIGSEPTQALNIGQLLAEKRCERIVPTSIRLQIALGQCNALLWSGRPEIGHLWAFFEANSEKHITVRQVQRIISEAALCSIGRPVNPHVLRHTFATRLMRVTSTPVVQQLLGHKHLSSTQVYVHPNGEDCKEAILKLS